MTAAMLVLCIATAIRMNKNCGLSTTWPLTLMRYERIKDWIEQLSGDVRYEVFWYGRYALVEFEVSAVRDSAFERVSIFFYDGDDVRVKAGGCACYAFG